MRVLIIYMYAVLSMSMLLFTPRLFLAITIVAFDLTNKMMLSQADHIGLIIIFLIIDIYFIVNKKWR